MISSECRSLPPVVILKILLGEVGDSLPLHCPTGSRGRGVHATAWTPLHAREACGWWWWLCFLAWCGNHTRAHHAHAHKQLPHTSGPQGARQHNTKHTHTHTHTHTPHTTHTHQEVRRKPRGPISEDGSIASQAESAAPWGCWARGHIVCGWETKTTTKQVQTCLNDHEGKCYPH